MELFPQGQQHRRFEIPGLKQLDELGPRQGRSIALHRAEPFEITDDVLLNQVARSNT